MLDYSYLLYYTVFVDRTEANNETQAQLPITILSYLFIMSILDIGDSPRSNLLTMGTTIPDGV